MNDPENTLDELRDSIINKALIYGSSVAVITYLLSLIEFFSTGFEVSFITDLCVVLTIVIVTIKRKSISISVKSYLVLACIFVVVIVDVVEIGILSANKVLLILIPFFSVISLSTKRSILLFTMTILVICCIAFLHIDGFLSPISTNTLGFSAWAINLLLILLVTIVILLIVTRFNATHRRLINDLLSQNKALDSSKKELAIYRDELEELVKERTSELNETYRDLQLKTENLENTVTRLNETKEELIQAEKMAAMGSLASGVAHEINNPLNFINGGVEVLEGYAANHFSKDHLVAVKPMLDAIKEGVNRSASIVESLNQYASTDTVIEKNDINQILMNCVALLTKQIIPEIQVSTHLDGIGAVKASKGDLYQLFFSVLNNAVEAIEGAGSISITTRNGDNAKMLVLVEDSGKGVQAKYLSQLTDPFFSTKGVGEGIGLGLYIASKILKKYNGSIKFASKVKQGTTVTIGMPISP